MLFRQTNHGLDPEPVAFGNQVDVVRRRRDVVRQRRGRGFVCRTTKCIWGKVFPKLCYNTRTLVIIEYGCKSSSSPLCGQRIFSPIRRRSWRPSNDIIHGLLRGLFHPPSFLKFLAHAGPLSTKSSPNLLVNARAHPRSLVSNVNLTTCFFCAARVSDGMCSRSSFSSSISEERRRTSTSFFSCLEALGGSGARNPLGYVTICTSAFPSTRRTNSRTFSRSSAIWSSLM